MRSECGRWSSPTRTSAPGRAGTFYARTFFLERLAPELDGIYEPIFLGDLFDFLFGSVADAVEASSGLVDRSPRAPGQALVFLSGNHDHHLVHRDDESRLEAALGAR